MAEYTITIRWNGTERSFPCSGEETLLEVLRRCGYQVEAPCGGNGTCKQCKVTGSGRCRDYEGVEKDSAEEEVLACRTYAAGDLTVLLPETRGDRVLTDAVGIAPGGQGLGLAVDIGTTTVAAYLYDLETGKCLATRGEMNAQRSFGGDVISRIRHASEENGLAELRDAIRGQVKAMTLDLCPETEKIKYVSIAGNTVMEHLFAGLSPESIGVAPFTPLSLFGTEQPARDYLDFLGDDCLLYLCPAVAGYVGGDITAGLLSSGAAESHRPVLFIDIGTNGEMALGSRHGFVCCATAAGPAFEGAEITCGSPARDGAIDRVEPDLSWTMLGEGEPRSICGSGIIDAVAALLVREEIDESGYLEAEEFPIAGSVYISGQDVRKIQLAKAAVRAGIETLLEKANMGSGDVGEVLIAGGFGAYLRIESACAIGLLPPLLREKTRYVGNSAGKGAALALTPEGRKALEKVSGLCAYEELSSSPMFNEKYIEAMIFDEWEDVYPRG